MKRAICELCGRETKAGTTAHHLIPRACHRNKWFRKRFSRDQMRQTVDLCRDCHSAVHQFIPSEKVLGRSFHTLEQLRAHPKLAKYLQWVRARQ